MKTKNALSILFLSWFVSTCAIVGVAFVLKPDIYVNEFWYRVAWTEFLNILFWFGNSGWFIENKNNTQTALLQTTSLFTSIYCIISFALILGFYKAEISTGINDNHLIMQIILFAIYALLMLRLSLAGHFADKDMVIQSSATISPLSLGQKIKVVENNYPREISENLKRLREKITYSLQDNNKTRSNSEYKNLIDNIISKLNNKNFTCEDIKRFIIIIDSIKNNLKGE